MLLKIACGRKRMTARRRRNARGCIPWVESSIVLIFVGTFISITAFGYQGFGSGSDSTQEAEQEAMPPKGGAHSVRQAGKTLTTLSRAMETIYQRHGRYNFDSEIFSRPTTSSDAIAYARTGSDLPLDIYPDGNFQYRLDASASHYLVIAQGKPATRYENCVLTLSDIAEWTAKGGGQCSEGALW